jgi:hypothetical protein
MSASIDDVPEFVRTMFERIALDVAAKGRKRYSADAIGHHLRWMMHYDRGDWDFKFNDHWTAPLARWFMERHPELPDFFELRVRKSVAA